MHYILALHKEGEDIPIIQPNNSGTSSIIAQFKSKQEAKSVIDEILKEQDTYYRKGLLHPSELSTEKDYKIFAIH